MHPKHCRDQFWSTSSRGRRISRPKPWDADVLRRDEIRDERGGCDPIGASEEAGRFAHDPLQAAALLMGDDDAEGADVRACFVGLVGTSTSDKAPPCRSAPPNTQP